MLRRLLFYAAVVLQLGLLLAMIGREAQTTIWGKRIMLRCIPVDPRSLFRGDYVILNYEFSNPDMRLVKGLKDVYKGQEVYVTLRKNGPFWAATGVYGQLPALADDEVFILGRVKFGGGIEYGIESYYVPEGKGRPIESLSPDDILSAEIALDRFGHGVVTQVFVNGRGGGGARLPRALPGNAPPPVP